MTDSRRFTVLFTPEEWSRIERRTAELRREDPRTSYTDVVRACVRQALSETEPVRDPKLNDALVPAQRPVPTEKPGD